MLDNPCCGTDGENEERENGDFVLIVERIENAVEPLAGHEKQQQVGSVERGHLQGHVEVTQHRDIVGVDFGHSFCDVIEQIGDQSQSVENRHDV